MIDWAKRFDSFPIKKQMRKSSHPHAWMDVLAGNQAGILPSQPPVNLPKISPSLRPDLSCIQLVKGNPILLENEIREVFNPSPEFELDLY